jgi:hypothetical protein
MPIVVPTCSAVVSRAFCGSLIGSRGGVGLSIMGGIVACGTGNFRSRAPDRRQCLARFKDQIEPMTRGNMRANGVRTLDVSCWQCHHRAIVSADQWHDDVPVPSFGPRMVCTRCGIIGADARPNWKERPERETLTGVQWR